MKLENIEVSPKQPNFISALKELEKIKIKTFACFTYGQVSFTLFEKKTGLFFILNLWKRRSYLEMGRQRNLVDIFMLRELSYSIGI